MRIFCLVCYFLMLFYGTELVVEAFTTDQPSSRLAKQQSPIKESVDHSIVCVYYPTYKVCQALSTK